MNIDGDRWEVTRARNSPTSVLRPKIAPKAELRQRHVARYPIRSLTRAVGSERLLYGFNLMESDRARRVNLVVALDANSLEHARVDH
jgi:hypothetical protein